MPTNCTLRQRVLAACDPSYCKRCGWNADVLRERRRRSVLVRGRDGLYRFRYPKGAT